MKFIFMKSPRFLLLSGRGGAKADMRDEDAFVLCLAIYKISWSEYGRIRVGGGKSVSMILIDHKYKTWSSKVLDNSEQDYF